MYLSRFGVKNYKCLGDIDIPLTPIHVLIGQNDCGKTSLLEAMAAFCATSEKPFSDVFPKPWTGRELVRHAATEPRITLCGEWERQAPDDTTVPFPRLRFGLSLDFAPSGENCQAADQWIETNGQKRLLWPANQSFYETSIKFWKDGNKPPAGPGVSTVLDDWKAISSVLKLAHKYALDAKLMAVPAAFDSIRKFRLDPDGFGLATLLDDILGFDPELFLRLRAEFCRFFPQFKSVRIESVQALQRGFAPNGLHSAGSTIGKGIYFETVSGQTVRAQQASDGAILFLGFLALAYLPDPPNLLLIEEPETGIYPTRLGQVITLLKQLVNRTEGVRFPQIILTTHSPYVLSFFEPEEVTLLSRPPDAPDAPVRARPLRDAPHIRERMAEDELYLGELWYNFTEKEVFGDS
jgi:hypothetical protein